MSQKKIDDFYQLNPQKNHKSQEKRCQDSSTGQPERKQIEDPLIEPSKSVQMFSKTSEKWQKKYSPMHFPSSNSVSSLRLPHHTRRLWASRKPHLYSIAAKQKCTVEYILEVIYQNILECRLSKDPHLNISVLAEYFEKNDSPFTLNLLSKIASYALEVELLFPQPVPILTKYRTSDLSLSSRQIRSLLSLMFFCVFPKQENSFDLPREYSFAKIFQEDSASNDLKLSKLHCVLNYFKRQESPPDLQLTFTRKFLQKQVVWEGLNLPLSQVELISEKNCTEDYREKLMVDFANKYIGGGSLSSGAVQEEIMFLKHVEPLVSVLFTEKLEDKECLFIQGAQRFNRTTGYKSAFTFSEDFKENIFIDELSRNRSYIVAIDANDYSGRTTDQFTFTEINRELNKALVGFDCKDITEVISGRWGCGAFKGDDELKFIIQWLAASASSKSLYYLLWEADPEPIQTLIDTVQNSNLTVKDLYKFLRSLNPSTSVIKLILDKILNT